MKNRVLQKGLNAYQIKVIALIAMTIDHLAAYGSDIPLFSAYGSKLRIIGRIAAPLFLYMVTEAVRHTSNRKQYLLRLYIGAICTGLFSALTNALFGNTIGTFSFNNILFTFLYTAMLIILIENVAAGMKERKLNQVFIGAAGIATVFALHYVYLLLRKCIPSGTFALDLLNSFLISPIRVEYSVLFVLMGIAVVLKEKDKVIGLVSMAEANRAVPAYELGFGINTSYQRKGYCYEAVKSVIDTCFQQTDIQMFTVSHYSYNTASQKIVSKLGFIYEGTLHNARHHSVFGPSDLVCYYLER